MRMKYHFSLSPQHVAKFSTSEGEKMQEKKAEIDYKGVLIGIVALAFIVFASGIDIVLK